MIESTLLLLSGHWVTMVIVFIIVFLVVWSSYRKTPNIPPGPKSIPVIGSLQFLKSGDKRKIFKDMRDTYGDVFSFYVGNRLIVVFNGFETLKEAFVKRADVFSDRPHTFTVDRVGQGKGIVNTSGLVWKEQRKFALTALRQFGFGKASFEDKIQDEVSALLRVLDHITGSDIDPQDIVQTAIANVICSIVLGKRFEYDDPLFKKFLDIFEENMRIVGGTSILNFFPFLKYIPGDIFKFDKVLENVVFVQKFIRETVERHRRDYDPNDVRDFVDAYLKEMEEEKANNPETTFNYDQMIKVIGDLFVGGTETTATTIRWGIIFLVRNPDVQKRMREEIDRYVQQDGRPSLKNKSSMAYTKATVLEIQRYADIAPFAVAHGMLQDATFKEFDIPKGSILIPNVHSVLWDPEVWKDPEVFRPERFLDNSGKVVKPEEFIPFFMGRRVCLGESLAKMELFLFLSAIVHRYCILPPEGEDLPGLDGVIGVTYTPLPYKVRFVRRV